jgi:hypothetical protein
MIKADLNTHVKSLLFKTTSNSFGVISKALGVEESKIAQVMFTEAKYPQGFRHSVRHVYFKN